MSNPKKPKAGASPAPVIFDPEAALEAIREEAPRPRKARLLSATSGTPSDPLKADFRKFLYAGLKFLLKVAPTELQYDLARYLQHGPKRGLIMAFRGASKSWVTCFFGLWFLYCDPQKKVLVVSASATRANQMGNMAFQLIMQWPLLKGLKPRSDQRMSSAAFDVGPATPDQSPSFKCAGITGQITGSRADLIIPDDVEIPANSATPTMQEKLAEQIKEFDSIIKPGGLVKYLGTPQVDTSVYNVLPSRGYAVRIWPARFPNAKQLKRYGPTLSPLLAQKVRDKPALVGQVTEPERFSMEDMAARELSYGKSGFALQFMLDTSLADVGRYPLKLRDLIVTGLDKFRGPDNIAWGNDDRLVHRDLPALGMEGDRFYRPASVSDSSTPYTKVVAQIDPSGRGVDHTGLTIVGELHARLFLLYSQGFADGYSPATMRGLASAIVNLRCSKVRIEVNYGGGMFTALFTPYLEEAAKEARKAFAKAGEPVPADFPEGIAIEETKSGQAQKELRVLEVLEPLMNQHRLIVSSEVVEADAKAVGMLEEEHGAGGFDGMRSGARNYSLFYQMTHLTRDRDSLAHDDLVESLAECCREWIDMLAVRPEELAKLADTEAYLAEMERLFGADDEPDAGERGGAVIRYPGGAERRS